MKRYIPHVVGLGVGSVLILLFFFQFVIHLTRPLSLFHNDWYLLTFMLNHFMNVIESGNWSSWSSYPMFYGYNNSVFFGEFFPIHILVGYPLYALTHNIFLVSNMLVLGSILFTYGSGFLFSFYVTRRMWPSVLAGVIYAVNPYIMARFPDHLFVVNAGVLPLLIVSVELFLEKPSKIPLGWVCMLLSLQLLTSSIYYSIFLTVMLPIYVCIRVAQQGLPEKKAVLNGQTMLWFAVFISLCIGIYAAYGFGNTNLKTVRSKESSAAYSANLTDWLFTAPNNRLYGALKPWAAKTYPGIVREGIYSEHNLFTGILPFLLGVAGLFVFIRQKRDPRLVAVGIIGITAWILSMGPEITVSDSWRIPGVYRVIQQINPLFSYLRVPSRFAVFVFFALSVFVAHGLAFAQKHLSAFRYSVLIGIICVGIAVEYSVSPFEFLDRDSRIQMAYNSISGRGDIRVIVEYPMGNSIDYAFPQARMQELDAHYLAYALLYHNKKLFNGYSGYIPRDYQKRADFLSVNFPTRGKVTQLKRWGVDALIVHRNELKSTVEYEQLNTQLKTLGVRQLYDDGDIAVYDLTAWPIDP